MEQKQRESVLIHRQQMQAFCAYQSRKRIGHGCQRVGIERIDGMELVRLGRAARGLQRRHWRAVCLCARGRVRSGGRTREETNKQTDRQTDNQHKPKSHGIFSLESLQGKHGRRETEGLWLLLRSTHNVCPHAHPCIQASLLSTNALMILNRPRFLAKYGLDDINNHAFGDPSTSPLRVQAIGLLQAVQYLKVPVIIANALVVVFELILGGT